METINIMNWIGGIFFALIVLLLALPDKREKSI